MGFVTPTPLNLPPLQIGVDIGQKHDPTAIAVVEVSERASRRMRHVDAYRDRAGSHAAYDTPIIETVYTAHMLERLPLGTRYPEVATRVASVVCNPRIAGRARRVLIDETGVGRPVYEMVAEAVYERPNNGGRGMVTLKPIIFTHGDIYEPYRHGDSGGGGRLGKARLVSRLQALIQMDRLNVPEEHPEAAALFAEIMNYEIHVDQNANDTYGAFKVGTHDDLVTALGLAVLEDPADYTPTIGPRIF